MKLKLFALCLIATSAATAQTFNSCLDEIEVNNPTLAAERASQMAETMARVADNRLGATEVEFGYLWAEPGEAPKLEFGISQAFDWPGVYGARRRASRSASAALAARSRATRRQVRLQASESLCRLVDANMRCALLESIVANLDSLHESMHAMLESRQITELDHRKVALEEVAMKQQLTDARQARLAALGELTTLNGGTLPAGVEELSSYPDEKLLPLADYLQAETPDVEALRADAATRRLAAKAEKLGLLPGFSLGYSFAREEWSNFHGISVGLRLPEYSAKPKADAAKWEAAALELQAEQADRDRRTAITADYAAAELNARLIADYQRAFGSDYPQLLKRSLAGGQISYIEYFSELNFFLSAHLDYLTRRLDYHTLLTTLRNS